MKYFTKELWLEAQDQKKTEQNRKAWDKAHHDYRAELDRIKLRLSAEHFLFFSEADVHDGELLQFKIIDGSRPAPLTETQRPWRNPGNYPVRVELAVIDAVEKYIWSISYSKIKRVVVDFPGSEPLFFSDGEGFGDWGYHEITEAENGFLRHEVMFSSGAVLLIEFGDVNIRRDTGRIEQIHSVAPEGGA